VKTICAWCGKDIGSTCDHCNGKLLRAATLGGTLAFYGEALVCLNGETPIIYLQSALDAMPTSHGICNECLDLPSETRDAILLEHRRLLGNRESTSFTTTQAQRDTIVTAARKNTADRPDALTYPPAKRGPKGVPPKATSPAPAGPKKP
jgi:hypothetical protein